MKKRKIKLFASVASLAMVAAVMGVGVWAASQQAVSVTSTIQFQATSIAGTIDLAVSGAIVNGVDNEGQLTGSTYTKGEAAAAALVAETDINLATYELTDEINAEPNTTIALQFNDADGDGLIEESETITYTFTITKTAGEDIFYKVVNTMNEGTHFEVASFKIDDSTVDAFTGTYLATTAVSDEAKIAIEYKVKEDIAAFTANTLSTVQISLANTQFMA